jgi:hypothetical protein
MGHINIIKAFDNGLSYNRTFDYNDKEYLKNISLSIWNRMTISEQTDIVSIESSVTYSVKEEQLFNFKVVMFFNVEGWTKEISPIDENKIKEMPIVEYLIDTIIGYLRGSLSALSKNTPVENLILPLIPAKDLVQNLIVKVQ